MAYEFKVTRRIEFSETDMAGIVHFSNFFRYMEIAEHGFYRALGYSVVMHQFDPPLGFPRVHAECDYRKPLRFEDLLEIHLLVKEKKPRVLTYVFKFRNITAEPVEIARGLLTVVCVSHTPGKMEAVSIPVELASQIETAPPESLL
jgi:YbgC/YbaW family acyl-CoA thioester hydrolase